ncbi:DUF4236 domain-containing protein [Catenulispora sp. NF23]|uniref:DUF4236 domain-containing protein n=1 Tax=Catenulispora pinistramenti TaxID=2705254 RepID=UPI001BA60258|nr:DUF4236 domain-containing protein [Catenulispora pinistramenti]MBS2536967.1 DUF4236 domain-containing protein [Catenulispora pinistramenti]
MGIRYRKTFRAGPIRVTASKSGISYSAGVKGARVTKRADGRVQTMLSAPGTGLRYTESSGSTKEATGSRTTKDSMPPAAPKNRDVKPCVPTRVEVERIWRSSREPLHAHGPRISDRKAGFLAGLMALLAEPGEETRFSLAVSKLNPSRDVLVLTSQRLLMFQANQVLRSGQIVAIDLSSVREVTVRRRPWSTSLLLHDTDGVDRMVCGTVSPKGLAWLREVAKDDSMFVLPG